MTFFTLSGARQTVVGFAFYEFLCFLFLGALARTFGRMRMIRKIMLPLAFIGGFMTAVILAIKMTGLINMLMIKKVLLLQMAIVLGKLIYGFKELLLNKHDHQSYASPPQAYYIPVSNGHGGGWSSREDDTQPGYYNQQPNYPLAYGRPQTVPFSGYSPQASHQVRTAPLFSQSYNQGRTHDYESIDNQVLGESGSHNQLYYDLSRPASTIDSLSPQEMTKLLSDTLARVSQRTTPSPVYNRSPNIPNYLYSNRS
jgi:hypothetical protein